MNKALFDEKAARIKSVINANKRMIRQLALQNQALASLLPRAPRPKKVQVYNPFSQNMEDIDNEKKKQTRKTGTGQLHR